MSRSLAAVVVVLSGCSLYFGGSSSTNGGDDVDDYPWIDTCGGQPTAEDTCTPGDSCTYEDWEHGCECGCDEDGRWACFNETIGSHCPTGEYGVFGEPVRLDGVSSPLDERAPAIAADGSELVFARPGPNGDLDLWRSHVALDGSLEAPVRDAALSRSPTDESDPSLSADGLTVYFSRNGNTLQASGGAITAVPELVGVTGADFSRPADTALVAASAGAVIEYTRPGAATPWTEVGRVDQMGVDASPTMRSDGHEAIFEGERNGKRALFVAIRFFRDEPWQSIVPLSIYGMDDANVGDPELSADGLTLLFVSDVGGNYDVYAMSRYRM